MSSTTCKIDGIEFQVEPKVARKLKDNSSFWVDRKGKVYNVYTDEHDGHWDWALGHGLDSYDILEQRGWLHVSSWHVYYYPNGRMKWSKAQIDKIEKWLTMNQKPLEDSYGSLISLAEYMAAKPEWF
jgi:hypothetical protein